MRKVRFEITIKFIPKQKISILTKHILKNYQKQLKKIIKQISTNQEVLAYPNDHDIVVVTTSIVTLCY